jgi:hypothetical protein
MSCPRADVRARIGRHMASLATLTKPKATSSGVMRAAPGAPAAWMVSVSAWKAPAVAASSSGWRAGGA